MRSTRRPFLPGLHPGKLVLAALLVALIGYCGYRVGRWVWAGRQLDAAEAALSAGDLEAAREYLDRCASVRPEQPEVFFLKARLARCEGNAEEAAALLRRCEQLGGGTETIRLERQLLAVQTGSLTDLAPLLFAYVEKDHPDAPFILEALARGCAQSYRLERAQKAADRWRQMQPENPRAWVLCGIVLYHLHAFRSATESYSRAVELAPRDAKARQLLAEAYAEIAQPASALEQYRALRELRPDDFAARLGEARCHVSLGQPDEALPILEELLARRPDDAEALMLRGRAELQRGEPARAEPWLRRAVEKSPYHRELVHTLMQCYRRLGRDADAKRWGERLERIMKDQDRLLDLTRRIHQSPRDAALRCQAAKIFLDVGNEKEGLLWLQSAMQEDPNNAEAQRMLREHLSRKEGVRPAARSEPTPRPR